MLFRSASLFSLVALLFSCESLPEKTTSTAKTESIQEAAPIYYSVRASYPHSILSFTEGLYVQDGKIYEGTGSPQNMPETRSLIGILDLKTGELDVKTELDRNKYFGEGIVQLNGKIYQLTWDTKIGFVYDATTFNKLGDFTFPSREGWGMTTDSTHLIMSDGTNQITYLDPVTFKAVKTLSVTENGSSRDKLNELEYINGFLYANVWTTHMIVKIDPSNGKIVGKMDISSLAYEAKNINPKSLETNGIAYDAAADKIYVTGKMWPKIYEISFAH